MFENSFTVVYNSQICKSFQSFILNYNEWLWFKKHELNLAESL